MLVLLMCLIIGTPGMLSSGHNKANAVRDSGRLYLTVFLLVLMIYRPRNYSLWWRCMLRRKDENIVRIKYVDGGKGRTKNWLSARHSHA